MSRPRKTMVPPEEGGHINRLLGRLAARHSNIMTAEDAMSSWMYLDFMDPKTGLPSIAQEWFIGGRGLVAGRIAQLRATYSKGKSSYCMLQYGAAQKTKQAFCYHVETEGSATPADRIFALGANPKELLQAEHSSLEECLSSIDELICEIRGGFGGSVGATGRNIKTQYTDPIDAACEHPILIGVDSLSALGKQDRVDTDVADMSKNVQIANTAKTLREYFRERVQRFNQKKVLLLLTTQETVKLEMGVKAFNGPQKTSVAAEAIGIHSTYGIDFDSSKWIDKKSGVQLGDILKLKTFKNKVSPRNRVIEMFLTTNNGFDLIHTDANFLIDHPSSPFAEGTNPFGGGKIVSRNPYGIKCELLSDKTFKSEEEFVRAFYDNQEILTKCREHLRIRGFGFDFETRYDQYDNSGNLVNEIAEDDEASDTSETSDEDLDQMVENME